MLAKPQGAAGCKSFIDSSRLAAGEPKSSGTDRMVPLATLRALVDGRISSNCDTVAGPAEAPPARSRG
jgi:hypothetical protein